MHEGATIRAVAVTAGGSPVVEVIAGVRRRVNHHERVSLECSRAAPGAVDAGRGRLHPSGAVDGDRQRVSRHRKAGVNGGVSAGNKAARVGFAEAAPAGEGRIAARMAGQYHDGAGRDGQVTRPVRAIDSGRGRGHLSLPFARKRHVDLHGCRRGQRE